MSYFLKKHFKFDEKKNAICQIFNEDTPIPILAVISVSPKDCYSFFSISMDSLVEKSNDDDLDINSLPNEIILKIFGYLKQNQLGQIARVCRRWSLLTRSSMLWKKVNVEFSPSHVSQTTVAKNFVCLLPSCVTSLRLDFRYRDDWTERLNFEELSVKLQELSPHLEMLILDRAILSNTLSSVIDLCTKFLQNVKFLVLHNAEFPVFSSTRECDSTSKIEVLDLFGSYLGCNVQDNSDILTMPLLKKLRLARTDVDNSWFENNLSLLIQLHVLDLGFTKIDSRTFQKIKNHSLNLNELYLCWVYLENYDLNFSNSVFPKLETICLRSCFGVTCEGVLLLIQSCPSLQTVYADEEVAESYARHPFVAVNKCKSKIVQVLSTCFDHQKINYVCN